MSLKERFNEKWKKEDATDEIKDECWIWKGADRGENSYGAIMVNGKKKSAHRVSVKIYKDKNIGDQHVLHKCHQKLCVKPSHLYLGYPKDNIQDAFDRGTFTQTTGNGQDNIQAKLTKKEVKEIRRRYENENITYQELADEYDVEFGHIGKIIRKERWAWLD